MSREVKKKASQQAGLIQKYQNVFETHDGREVLMDLMKKHGLLSENFDGNVNNALVRIGERKVVLGILTNLNYDVNKLKERIDEYENDNG